MGLFCLLSFFSNISYQKRFYSKTLLHTTLLGGTQCNQMTRLLFQYWAFCNNFFCQSRVIILTFTKLNFKIATVFKNVAKKVKFIQRWSHRAIRKTHRQAQVILKMLLHCHMRLDALTLFRNRLSQFSLSLIPLIFFRFGEPTHRIMTSSASYF